MKRFFLILLLCILIIPAVALSSQQVQSTAVTSSMDLPLNATFGEGQRYQAGNYPVIVLSGSYREMGRQYGGLMKTEINDEYNVLVKGLIRQGYTKEMLTQMARDEMDRYPARQIEVFTGIAETTGLSVEDIVILYNGLLIALTPAPSRASCSYLAAWDNYTTNGSVIASRNWDLPDSLMEPFNKWYVLVVYRPSDGSNGVATFGPVVMRPETYMNSKGLFIADDNAGLPTDVAKDLRPDIISGFFRLMLDSSDLNMLMIALNGSRPDAAWIIDVAGPEGAYVYEVMTNNTKVRSGDGVVAAANHFVDPSWNLPTVPEENSLIRYNNLLRQADDAKGSINAKMMIGIRNVLLENGGATFNHSVLLKDYPDMLYSANHQVIFVPETRTLWMKVVDKDWQKVELGTLFDR